MGKNKINIAAMVFGRKTLGGEAVSILNIDSPVPAAVLEQIKHTENILEVKAVIL
jgi:D-3-phosphoglycerate dehydrogenase